LSIWGLAAVRQALQRGKGGSDRQGATCVKYTGGLFVVTNNAESFKVCRLTDQSEFDIMESNKIYKKKASRMNQTDVFLEMQPDISNVETQACIVDPSALDRKAFGY